MVDPISMRREQAWSGGIAPHRSAPESPQEVTAGSAQGWKGRNRSRGKGSKKSIRGGRGQLKNVARV